MNSRQKIVQQQFLNNEKAIIQELNTTYNQTLNDITTKIQEYYATIDQLTAIIEQLDKDDPRRVILESQRQSVVYQKEYQEALQKQISDVLDNLHKNEYTTVSDYLERCYDDGFLGAMYDLHGQGIPLTIPMNQQKIVHAVQLDSKISVGLYTRLGQDVDKLKKRITAQISRSMVMGDSFAKCAQRLDGIAGIGYNNAVRIARTEGHRIQCQAGMDALTDAKGKGAAVVKQWDAALDGRTRPTHRAVDGEIREVEEPFSNGLMFPGDPSGHPAEVINCRCALLQRGVWALSESELDTLKERAEQHKLWLKDEDKSAFDAKKQKDFTDFKKTYLKATDAVAKDSGSGIMKDIDDMLIPITEESINSVPFVKVYGWSDEMADALQKAHQDLLKEAAKHPLGTETASIHTLDMKRIGDIIVGENTSVHIPDANHAYIALHTHPSGLTFSHQDIVLFLKRDGLKTLTALGNDGSVYILHKSNDYDKKAAERLLLQSRDRINNSIKDGSITEYISTLEYILKEVGAYGVEYYH